MNTFRHVVAHVSLMLAAFMSIFMVIINITKDPPLEHLIFVCCATCTSLLWYLVLRGNEEI